MMVREWWCLISVHIMKFIISAIYKGVVWTETNTLIPELEVIGDYEPIDDAA